MLLAETGWRLPLPRLLLAAPLPALQALALLLRLRSSAAWPWSAQSGHLRQLERSAALRRRAASSFQTVGSNEECTSFWRSFCLASRSLNVWIPQ